MKQSLHPTTYDTAIHCNGCDTSFSLRTTVPNITVETCSNCHPFYTGKQKLLDTAGRVDKFKARQAEATRRAEALAARQNSKDPDLVKIQHELQDETVDKDSVATDEA